MASITCFQGWLGVDWGPLEAVHSCPEPMSCLQHRSIHFHTDPVNTATSWESGRDRHPSLKDTTLHFFLKDSNILILQYSSTWHPSSGNPGSTKLAALILTKAKLRLVLMYWTAIESGLSSLPPLAAALHSVKNLRRKIPQPPSTPICL